MAKNNLIVVNGQEGAGKSTIVRALLRKTTSAAQIDAEDVGHVNPFNYDKHFKHLLWKNVAMLTQNYWQAGFSTVIAGSFANDYEDYRGFRTYLRVDANIYLVHLCAAKSIRDQRRIERPKPSSKEWRDWLDQHYPEDKTLQADQSDYRYIRVENTSLTVDETVEHIIAAIPEIYTHLAV